jgi:hypothetical protein
MTKARNQYIYQLTGTIQSKTLHKASPTSKYAGQAYYKLYTNLENQPNKVLQVFPDKLFSPSIWASIEQGQCLQKKYLFKCRNQRGFYYLVDWEEIK